MKKSSADQHGGAATFHCLKPPCILAHQNVGKKRSSREDDYASDDGFVANESDEGGRSRKKTKTAATKRAPPKKAGHPKDEEELWEVCHHTSLLYNTETDCAKGIDCYGWLIQRLAANDRSSS